MRRSHIRGSIAAAALVVPAIALAQDAPSRDYAFYHGPSMMWGFAGWRDAGMTFAPILMIALIAALVAGTIYLLRLVVPEAKPPRRSGTSPSENGALAILRERFARGEIDAQEFDERRSRLQR